MTDEELTINVTEFLGTKSQVHDISEYISENEQINNDSVLPGATDVEPPKKK